MITTGALIHGDVTRHLDFSEQEHPLALQLGGSDPVDLARCAKLAEQWGYDEVNLNCGCPSERVQRGSFGACLMKEPLLVADCLKAMRDACDLTITVKHRIGVDDLDSYEFTRDFVGTIYERSGVSVFIVHARKAYLKGLSPKENRTVPPLDYNVVRQLKQDFPALTFVLNGGLETWEHIQTELEQSNAPNGVMLGRAAYQNPWLLQQVDPLLFNQPSPVQKRLAAVEQLIPYLESLQKQGLSMHVLTRHMLGLFNGQPNARYWRQTLSDQTWMKQAKPTDVLRLAEHISTPESPSSLYSSTLV
jgi:tRNA-dihydrouridine synthase A